MQRKIFGGAVILACALFASRATLEAPTTVQSNLVESGHQLALFLCSTCHAVDPDQEFPPALINPAPSFDAIANRPDTTRDSLRRFLATTHGDVSKLPLRMPNLTLTDSQKESAIAYILSLRGDPAAKGKQVDPHQ